MVSWEFTIALFFDSQQIWYDQFSGFYFSWMFERDSHEVVTLFLRVACSEPSHPHWPKSWKAQLLLLVISARTAHSRRASWHSCCVQKTRQGDSFLNHNQQAWGCPQPCERLLQAHLTNQPFPLLHVSSHISSGSQDFYWLTSSRHESASLNLQGNAWGTTLIIQVTGNQEQKCICWPFCGYTSMGQAVLQSAWSGPAQSPWVPIQGLWPSSKVTRARHSNSLSFHYFTGRVFQRVSGTQQMINKCIQFSSSPPSTPLGQIMSCLSEYNYPQIQLPP